LVLNTENENVKIAIRKFLKNYLNPYLNKEAVTEGGADKKDIGTLLAILYSYQLHILEDKDYGNIILKSFQKYLREHLANDGRGLSYPLRIDLYVELLKFSDKQIESDFISLLQNMLFESDLRLDAKIQTSKALSRWLDLIDKESNVFLNKTKDSFISSALEHISKLETSNKVALQYKDPFFNANEDQLLANLLFLLFKLRSDNRANFQIKEIVCRHKKWEDPVLAEVKSFILGALLLEEESQEVEQNKVLVRSLSFLSSSVELKESFISGLIFFIENSNEKSLSWRKYFIIYPILCSFTEPRLKSLSRKVFLMIDDWPSSPKVELSEIFAWNEIQLSDSEKRILKSFS